MLQVPNNSHMNGAGKTPTDKTHTSNVKSVQKIKIKWKRKFGETKISVIGESIFSYLRKQIFLIIQEIKILIDLSHLFVEFSKK